MTAITDAKAITPTATAKASAQKTGAADLGALHANMVMKLQEAKTLLQQVITATPGGDPNLTALNTLLAELT